MMIARHMLSRIIVVLLVFAATAIAQPNSGKPATQDVDLCELIHHPQSYDGQMIRVRGHVVFEFEDFSFDDSACHAGGSRSANDDKGVWLTLGGDEREIATYCCGSDNRKPGTNLQVAGHQVGLIRDAEFYRFYHQLKARRLRRPDGKECGAECKLYEVTATLSGLFAAASAERGYGHFGMFHLLAISQVSQVSPERNAVPFGGVFVCSTETWEPTRAESPELDRALRCTDATENGCAPSLRFSRVAAHWNDDVTHGSTTEGYTDTDGDQITNWVSSDLLTSYFTKATREHVSITKEHRKPVSIDHGPVPASVSIACQEYERALDDTTLHDMDNLREKNDFSSMWLRMADGAKLLFSTGDQSWRAGEPQAAAWHVLQEQSLQWDLNLATNLRLDKCQDFSSDETPILVGCSWYSPDATQTFDVSLLKEKHPPSATQVSSWVVRGVNAESCGPARE